ncbi:hypothetical protein ACQHIV_30535 [Kribbella sp. GL6]|uniref:hypothetical protein n=1 Tax=Kribbella sp. GL6 TaxID=3419765 RepID=UPI003D010C00
MGGLLVLVGVHLVTRLLRQVWLGRAVRLVVGGRLAGDGLVGGPGVVGSGWVLRAVVVG